MANCDGKLLITLGTEEARVKGGERALKFAPGKIGGAKSRDLGCRSVNENLPANSAKA